MTNNTNHGGVGSKTVRPAVLVLIAFVIMIIVGVVIGTVVSSNKADQRNREGSCYQQTLNGESCP